ncbi:Integrase [Stigmatella aurantiaca DW4/3-1]|uniref:Integrase n=2 Tax=Stigmatella aurantiaca TaxID=41 RepID=E3FSX8_STIAD|nr:Integrase [Stigmatella aurantiaca DW4/3-1]
MRWPRAIPRLMRFHGLRHTTATLLLKVGIPVPPVLRILRHSDPAITPEVYGHLDMEGLRKGLGQLDFAAAEPTPAEQSPAASKGEPPPLATRTTIRIHREAGRRFRGTPRPWCTLPRRRAPSPRGAHLGGAMQVMYSVMSGAVQKLPLPQPDSYVLPGIPWGAFDELLTPAFWRGQAWQHEKLGSYRDLRLGRTLTEEMAACMLGGFGMKAELGLAAFARLRDQGLLVGTPTAEALEGALSRSFVIHGRTCCYRFPRQKARYLSACLAQLAGLELHASDTVLRDRLADLPGIGLKTASWIVRNYRGSSEVAIIDVHILRAGRHMGLFAQDQEPQRHYRELEAAFLAFAAALKVPAAMLDGLMWDYMRRLPASVLVSTSTRKFKGNVPSRQRPSREHPQAVPGPARPHVRGYRADRRPTGKLSR